MLSFVVRLVPLLFSVGAERRIGALSNCVSLLSGLVPICSRLIRSLYAVAIYPKGFFTRNLVYL